jgi:hypothetical protein
MTTTMHMRIRLAAFIILPAMMVLAGCNRHDDHGHDEMQRVEILDRSQTERPVIATWVRGQGWDRQSLVTLAEGGQRISLGVRAFNGDGEQFEFGTLERHDDGTRTCTEYNMRYALAAGQPENVIRRPDNRGIVTVNGEQVAVFHCDHLYLYPQSAGATQIRFVLWHVDHADDATDPIGVTVQAQVTARAE